MHRSCDFREAPETRYPSCPTPELPPEPRRRRRNSSRGAPSAPAPEASAHALPLEVAPPTPPAPLPRFGEEGDYDLDTAVPWTAGRGQNWLAANWRLQGKPRRPRPREYLLWRHVTQASSINRAVASAFKKLRRSRGYRIHRPLITSLRPLASNGKATPYFAIPKAVAGTPRRICTCVARPAKKQR